MVMTSQQRAAHPERAVDPAVDPAVDAAADVDARPAVEAELADPYADWRPPALPVSRAFALADLRGAAILMAILAVLGGPVGLLWAVLAPHATAARSDGLALYVGFD